jgi:predicted RNA-binding Zn ribbon-like protein
MSPAVHLLGGHPALHFLNSAYGPTESRTELLTNGAALLQWMMSAGILDAATVASLERRLSARSLDAVATEARKLREWMRSWLDRWRAAPRRDYHSEIAALNKLLARATWRREVKEHNHVFRMGERAELDSADALIAAIASHVATLITLEQPALVKECAGPGCTLWFLDRTRAHARVFCSARGCGNRAKVAAFRERRRRS